jgi:glycosyltransferase involved in cell wall biosynthesis
VKIAINARIDPASGVGGVESVLIGLVKSLGQLTDGDEEYVLLTNARHPGWLDAYLGPNQKVVTEPSGDYAQDGKKKRGVVTAVRKEARRFYRRLHAEPAPYPTPRISNGFIESLGCEVVHFPYQHFEVCALPSIYNPHDLQHRHFPQFFTPEGWIKKDVEYRSGCEMATTVVTASQWIKDDICRQYNVNALKIAVIPFAPPTQAYAPPAPGEDAATRAKFGLPDNFAFYPAMTWPHKNHLRLLEALAYLKKERGLAVPLVCTGNRGPFWPKIEEAIQRLGLGAQVHFPGLVSREELQSIYRSCSFVIVPTLFEAASGPVFEAWNAGAAVACSNVTSLPQQVGDAALVFEPTDVQAIARAVQALQSDPKLRQDLIARGRRRLGDFTWDRTARAYRAVYRRAAMRPLSDEDQKLLSWDWMRQDGGQSND